MPSPRALRRLLIVEPDPIYRDLLQRLAHPLAKVEAAADLIRQKWNPQPPPQWITAVPSQRHSKLVQGADLLGGAGGIGLWE